MSRIRILVEGQMEETFVNDVLSPHLNQMGVYPHALLFRRRGGSFRYYQTCPSRRIEGVFQSFKKPIDGIIAAGRIGLRTMRQECPHFDEWIEKLENTGSQ